MSFAIEVPGEANPLNEPNLRYTLTQASSNDQQQVKTGTQQLSNWEKLPGFYSSLQSIFKDGSTPLETRYLCAIQIKNGIDKYWRKTASNAITKEEKSLVRSRCISAGIQEPDPRLALQNALVVAKIVRYDYPHDWPEAIVSVLNTLQQVQTGESVTRCLQILLYIIKELSTARLQRNRTHLQSAAPEIFSIVATIFVESVSAWITPLAETGNVSGSHILRMQQSLLAMRLLRRLLISGYQHPNRSSEVAQFWSLMAGSLNQVLSLLLQRRGTLQPEIEHLLEKHLMQFAKLHLDMAKSSPAGFVLLPGSVDLVKSYWGLICEFGKTFGSANLADITEKVQYDDDFEVSIIEKISLKGLLLVRACVKMVFDPAHTFRYRHPEDKEEEKRSREIIKGGLLADSFAKEVMETLVTRFFVYRPRDLKEWREEPDDWERREEGEGDAWEFSVRSCSEKLFLDIVIHFKDLLIQPLLTVFHSITITESEDLLLKDSIYSAIGLAAPVLEGHLDFATFLSTTLYEEALGQDPGYNILRRRIAIVLGQWLPVKEGLDRPLVYRIFRFLLGDDDPLNDLVVRVTAGRQLASVVDPFEFTAEPFMPYASDILGKLMKLVQQVDLSETKITLLTTVSIIVTKMESQITPFAEQIISSLPTIWEEAGEEYLLKQSILGILSGLVASMKQASQRYFPLVIPLIYSSVEPDSETRQYLLEEALDLWSSVLEHTPQPCPSDIANLGSNLFPMLDSASDTLIKALDIMEYYIYLMPQDILSSSAQLLSAWSPLLTSLKSSGILHVTHLIELLIKEAHSAQGTQPSAIEQLCHNLYEYNIINNLLLALKDAHTANQTTGPNRTYSQIDSQVETEYLSILARLTMPSPHLLLSILNTFDTDSGTGLGTTLNWLLAEWFSHFDNLVQPDRKKLSCMALTSLLNEPAASETVLRNLQLLMTVQTDTITEMVDQETRRDSLVLMPEEGDSDQQAEDESAAEHLKRILMMEDPIRRIDVKDYVRQGMSAAIQQGGGEETFRERWLINVDQDVLRAFGETGIL